MTIFKNYSQYSYESKPSNLTLHYRYTWTKKKSGVHKICNIYFIARPRIMKISQIENRLKLTNFFHKGEILYKK